MLKVEFTDDAKDYILQKSDSITVDLMLYGGCGGQFNEPLVLTGKPSLPESYDLVDDNGIKVYMFKNAVSKPDGIKISIAEARGIFKKLHVAGLVYEQPF
ncbi:MAG: CC/Se motif family (seleno)protein [Desulfotomaculaceae bacterium]|nr:CC/Se motif family (seleno)protein [Desulfotomaculaceae bacterium]